MYISRNHLTSNIWKIAMHNNHSYIQHQWVRRRNFNHIFNLIWKLMFVKSWFSFRFVNFFFFNFLLPDLFSFCIVVVEKFFGLWFEYKYAAYSDDNNFECVRIEWRGMSIRFFFLFFLRFRCQKEKLKWM